MKKIFENAIISIKELIKLREQQIILLNKLDKHQEATPLNFKIKNYNKWITSLNKCLANKIEIKSKNDIMDLKLTKSLEHKVIELFESGTIQNIEDTRHTLLLLEEELRNKNYSNNVNENVNENENKNENVDVNVDEYKKIKATTPKKEKATTPKREKASKLDTPDTTPDTTPDKLDTTKIEAQPKILAGEVRPSDLRGASIYDIRYLYGVGPKNAIKLVDSGITLEKILEEWVVWIKHKPDNEVLMISKMNIPVGYSKQQWDNLNEEKHRTIQLSILNDKLKKETKYLHVLNNHQLLGVKYFHDMSKKIPRYEVQTAEHILTSVATHMNKDIMLTLCGSYRRGKDKSGDIDCLITHKDIKTVADLEHSDVNILASFVLLLTNVGFLVDHLTDYGLTKYMGFCIIKPKNQGETKPIARRIDIRFIPFESYATAILYFTGSKRFNVVMRAHALKLGYTLNEYNLKRLSDNSIIPCKKEEDIFTFLKYPYKTPIERDIT